MAENNRTEWVGINAQKQPVEQDSGLVEEVKMLRQHVADMYRAWITGKAPPPPPPSFLDSVLTRTQNTMPDDPPYSPSLPAYNSFPNHSGNSITHHPTIIPQRRFPVTSTMLDKEHLPRAHNTQYCPSEVIHKGPNLHKQWPQDKPRVENGRFTEREKTDRESMKLKEPSVDRSSLSRMEKKPGESFREFGLRWREQAARINTSIDEEEMVEIFIQAQGPTYFNHLIPAVGRPFDDVLRMGELVEKGIKSGKIMSCSKDISVGSEVRERKRKDDPRGSPDQHLQPRHRTREYPHALDNPPRRHSSPRDSQRHTSRSKYPAPQNAYPPSRAYQKLPGSGFRPNQAFRNERLLKKEKAFTPIGESHASLFQKLKQVGMLKPIQIRTPNPLKCDFSLRCAYCSDAPGHDTEKCWKLKRAIQDLIDANKIEVKTPEALNTSQDPLPAQA